MKYFSILKLFFTLRAFCVISKKNFSFKILVFKIPSKNIKNNEIEKQFSNTLFQRLSYAWVSNIHDGKKFVLEIHTNYLFSIGNQVSGNP